MVYAPALSFELRPQSMGSTVGRTILSLEAERKAVMLA